MSFADTDLRKLKNTHVLVPLTHESPIETENVFSQVTENLESKRGAEIKQKKGEDSRNRQRLSDSCDNHAASV